MLILPHPSLCPSLRPRWNIETDFLTLWLWFGSASGRHRWEIKGRHGGEVRGFLSPPPLCSGLGVARFDGGGYPRAGFPAALLLCLSAVPSNCFLLFPLQACGKEGSQLCLQGSDSLSFAWGRTRFCEAGQILRDFFKKKNAKFWITDLGAGI